MKNQISVVLEAREENYGNFASNCAISQNIKHTMRASHNWNYLSSSQKESLEMIALKIARILNGNQNHHDSWHDIAGYATLVADELLANTEQENQ